MRLCEIDDCGRKYLAQGKCELHYGRMRRGGDVYAPVLDGTARVLDQLLTIDRWVSAEVLWSMIADRVPGVEFDTIRTVLRRLRKRGEVEMENSEIYGHRWRITDLGAAKFDREVA